MFKIKIISVGKSKEQWLEEALKEYIKRLTPIAQIAFVFVKDDQQLIENINQEESNIICLDATGTHYDSVTFAKFISNQLEQGGSRLSFVIGGPDGLPSSLKKNYPLLSLSSMTFTHQMVRLILLEQLYRAFEISRGSKYHK